MFILTQVYREVFQRLHDVYDITLAIKGAYTCYSGSNFSLSININAIMVAIPLHKQKLFGVHNNSKDCKGAQKF